MDNENNVLYLRQKTTIFPQELKARMEKVIGTEDAKRKVDELENATCNYFMCQLKDFGLNVGNSLADKLLSIFSKGGKNE